MADRQRPIRGLARGVIAAGGCVRLVVWGEGTPPVAIGVYDGPLGSGREEST